MPEVNFYTADDSPCLNCHEMVSLDEHICLVCGVKILPRIIAPDFYKLFCDGHIIDAREGGLILGRDTEEDDIPMITPAAAGVFQIIGIMQGGEYLINHIATSKHEERIKEINSYKGSELISMDSIKLDKKTRIFNTNNMKDKLVSLLVNGKEFVVNRAATAKYYDELVEINCSTKIEG